MHVLLLCLAGFGYSNQIRFSNYSPVIKEIIFFSSDKLDLAISYFQVSKENTKYKRHNNSM